MTVLTPARDMNHIPELAVNVEQGYGAWLWDDVATSIAISTAGKERMADSLFDRLLRLWVAGRADPWLVPHRRSR